MIRLKFLNPSSDLEVWYPGHCTGRNDNNQIFILWSWPAIQFKKYVNDLFYNVSVPLSISDHFVEQVCSTSDMFFDWCRLESQLRHDCPDGVFLCGPVPCFLIWFLCLVVSSTLLLALSLSFMFAIPYCLTYISSTAHNCILQGP